MFNAIGRKWLDVRTSNCYVLSSLAYWSKPEWKETTSFLWKIELSCRLCCSRGPLSPLLDTVSLNLQYHYYFLLLLRNKKISYQEITNLKKTPIKSKNVVSTYEKKALMKLPKIIESLFWLCFILPSCRAMQFLRNRLHSGIICIELANAKLLMCI